jgi:hypothetical protein
MDRVYVILDVMEGKHSEAVQSLRANPGVQWVDVLEGQWDVITAIEAPNRSRLAQLVVRAISSVETITEDIQLLPSRDGADKESKVESVGIVTTNKMKSSKQARYGRDGSNIPGPVLRRVSSEPA